jgi:hypothetical protein
MECYLLVPETVFYIVLKAIENPLIFGKMRNNFIGQIQKRVPIILDLQQSFQKKYRMKRNSRTYKGF